MPRDASQDLLDVVLFGASGFVGRLTAHHLAANGPPGLRVGLAGRSLARLAEVRAELGPSAQEWPLLCADSSDRVSLDALASSARVIATTVGPYARHGMALVEACVQAGTDYADLTGEVIFVRHSIDTCHAAAVRSGARIVHACGFDSVPSDLGVLLLADRARRDGAGDLTDTTLVVRSARGGISGGTIDSLRTQLDSVRADPGLRRLVADPYALSPDRTDEPDGPADGMPQRPVRRDRELGVWTVPFVMAPYNTRIVRRSNALAGYPYGRSFRYREVMSVGSGAVAPALAVAVAVGLGALTVGMTLPPARRLLDRVLPKPGTGPSEKVRHTGHFRLELYTRTTSGAEYRAVVAAEGDPGYAATAVMLGESALCLALDRDADLGAAPAASEGPARPTAAGGVLTPATAMGPGLVERLRAAGFELSASRR